MIKGIVQHLRQSLLQTGYFQQVFELCVQVNQAGNIFPASYSGNGDLQDVTLFDQFSGMAYFRKIGDTKKEPYTGVKTRPCPPGTFSDYTYELKIVGCVPKEKASCDDAYADDEICSIIMNHIDNPTGLRAELSAQGVSVLTTSYSTDSSKILKEEYPNKKKEDFDYKFAYFSLSVTAVITISQICFAQNCYNGTLN